MPSICESFYTVFDMITVNKKRQGIYSHSIYTLAEENKIGKFSKNTSSDNALQINTKE